MILHFLYISLQWWGFDFAPARGDSASVSDGFMTSKDYIKLSMLGLDFLVLVLQRSNSFDLISFFQVLLSLILTVYKGDIQLTV